MDGNESYTLPAVTHSDYVNNKPNGNGEFILTNETMGDLGFFRTFTSDGMWEHGDEIVVTGE